MEVKDAKHIYLDGYPFLQLTINGVEHLVSDEQKPALVRHGFVSVSDRKYTDSIFYLFNELRKISRKSLKT